ncbi:HesA/MoeB/ThiF family protein [Roseivivax isoporae]|uniref:Thiazole biosynthesis protein ThiF n=1 Tax=Roseivivax isoporae LMG 25204 TaxID=1449351 RepID=X7FDL9_9RHOB|nr:HesA/MoeB/ThiF family protein [Roseivivax isoporae]ETX30139.1 thiazole biosynthesis protein ThiF [Roseivivax isoporae LMG 25204]
MTRHARQLRVPGFGAEGQARLAAARVLVVGAGGLAAPVLQYLVGAGAGAITLVDDDRVAESNLHRQTLFRMDDIGTPKATAAAATLARLDPAVRIDPVVTRLDPANAAALAREADLVLDCADSFAASYTLSDLCAARGLPLIHASVIGLEGYAGGFCGGAPSLRAVFPDLPQRMGSCAEDGVLGPVVGVIGALQAQMAVAALAGMAPSPLGRLVSYDAAAHRFGGFGFAGAEEPARRHGFIAAADIRADDVVVDLRRPDEGPLAHPGALRLEVARVAEGLAPCDARAVLCCRSGLRAWQAAERLAPHWPGEIVLVALGDAGPQEDTPQGDAP